MSFSSALPAPRRSCRLRMGGRGPGRSPAQGPPWQRFYLLSLPRLLAAALIPHGGTPGPFLHRRVDLARLRLTGQRGIPGDWGPRARACAETLEASRRLSRGPLRPASLLGSRQAGQARPRLPAPPRTAVWRGSCGGRSYGPSRSGTPAGHPGTGPCSWVPAIRDGHCGDSFPDIQVSPVLGKTRLELNQISNVKPTY